MRKARWVVFLGACTGGMVAYYAVPRMAQMLIYDAMGFVAAIALFAGARLRARGTRRPWYLLSAGMLALVLGDAIWTTVELADGTVPFPSLADGLYLMAYPLWVAALLDLVRRHGGRNATALIEALIAMIAASVVSWEFLMRPLVIPGQPLLTLVTSLAYPFVDILMFAVLVRVIVGMDRYSTPMLLLMLGLGGTLVADVAYSIALLGTGYVGGTWIDLGWLVFYAAWGAAALHPYPTPAADAEPEPRSGPGYLRVIPFTVAALALPAVYFVRLAQGGDAPGHTMALASIPLYALAGTRIAMLLRQTTRDAAALRSRGDALDEALQELRHTQRERSRLLDRTVRAAEEERMHLAAELHDGPIQHLTALSLRVGMARTRLGDGEAGCADSALATVEREVGASIAELRRLMGNLRPPALAEVGLATALQDLLETFAQQTGTEIGLESRVEARIDDETEVVLYRIAQEALTNVAKHAGAGRVRVSLSAMNEHVDFEVDDDGVGFSPTELDRARPDDHFGLAGMTHRAEMLDGRLVVRSQPGGGTTIAVHVPAQRPG